MGFKEGSKKCPKCGERVLARKETPNHILHLLLTVVTVGLWIIVWALLISKGSAWRCSRCGTKLSGFRVV